MFNDFSQINNYDANERTAILAESFLDEFISESLELTSNKYYTFIISNTFEVLAEMASNNKEFIKVWVKNKKIELNRTNKAFSFGVRYYADKKEITTAF